MTEPEDFEEDLFADLYDGDDNTTTAAADSSMNTVAAEPDVNQEYSGPSGYGEEPDTSYIPPPFERDASDQHQNGFKREDDYSNNRGRGDNDTHMNNEPFGLSIKEDGKMFIGGLNWETTDQSLHDYFSQFGEVQECTVMRDGATGRSRGFGFLTFKDPKTVNTVMVKEHFLDGKIIDPKRAIPRDEQEKTSKIFVGGVSQEATEADFTAFFEQFGRVVDATLMMDKDTGRPRGFGFVTFDSEAAVEKCLEYHPLEIMGKPIEVKKAQPRGKMGEEEDSARGGRGRGKFGGRDDRFANDNNQAQGNAGGAMGAGGMTPQMMAQYWQRMQQYFAMMQQQMAATAMGGMSGMGGMGGMGQMNPQMMAQMQQMQQMQAMQKQMQGGGQSPAPQSPSANNMTPLQQQQMMAMMMQQGQAQTQGQGQAQGQGNSNNNNNNNNNNNSNGMNAPSGPRSTFTAAEQQAFEQQKYEQQVRRGAPHGPRANFTHTANASQSPQSWEGMYDDIPQPNDAGRGGAGVVRNLTPSNAGGGKKTPQPSAAPANAPTGPKNAGKPGANFRGGRGGGRFHPYGRG